MSAAPPGGLSRWLRTNLFRSWADGVVSVVAGTALGYSGYRLVRFVAVTGRWDIIRDNLTLFVVGRYPRDQLWRPAVALIVAASLAGLLAGAIARRQQQAMDDGERERVDVSIGARVRDLVDRFWPALVAALVLLSLTATARPWLVVAATLAASLAGRVLGARLPRSALAPLVVVAVAAPFVMVWFLARAVGWDDWGGMMLNVFLALAAIILCFPLGVLLALARRSKLPLLRGVATGYIELFRGSPLFVLLLMASVALGFFVPQSLAPGKVVRAIVVLTLFTAAYLAEIVRGGLQSLPPGQEEAGKALGLSPVRITTWIVLPQALRNVIPAQVGQLISLFKDTTLAGAAMGLFDVLTVGEAVPKQPEFAGQGLLAETFVFVGVLFWVGSYTMSRESQRLEARLGVGSR